MRKTIRITLEIEDHCDICEDNLKRIRAHSVGPNEVICLTAATAPGGTETHRHIQIIDTTHILQKDMMVRDLIKIVQA